MKIAQVVCAYPPYKSGIGTVAKKFHKTLQKSGHESDVFFPDYKNNIESDKHLHALKPCLKSGNGAFLPQLAYKLWSYDIVHLHYPFFGGTEPVWLAKAVFRQKFTLALHYHMEVDGFVGLNNLLRLPSDISRSQLWSQARAISCASIDYIENSEKHKKLFDKYRSKYHEIAFSVDTDFFHPLKNKKNPSLKILFVGGMDKAHYFKGIPVLLYALEKIKNLEWSLQLVGQGDLMTSYQKKAIELGLKNKVEFLGGIDDNALREVYQKNDLLVLPAINSNEAFGIVLLEAMASGLAVIASRLPGVRTVFSNEKEGYYFEPNNSDDLSDKIKKIINQQELLTTMSMQARKTVTHKYSDKIVAQKIITFYEDLLDK